MRMAKVPQPLVGSHQTLHIAAARAIRRQWPAGQHHFQNVQELLRHLKIALVAGMVEGDQNLIR